MAMRMRVTSRHVVIIVIMALLSSLLGIPAGVWGMVGAGLGGALGAVIMCMFFFTDAKRAGIE